ncbi:30S ribosomal protein S1 [Anseongella ginsenosidimutans]|uniref:30S ribosomal protein S1 n=1 Tax=Anseongella ginsenosidimutans TaxID=496056 RepID=UPI001CEF8779|nr:30S ribosomal protein S1 [Anseongella ginsenosidimutans]
MTTKKEQEELNEELPAGSEAASGEDQAKEAAATPDAAEEAPKEDVPVAENNTEAPESTETPAEPETPAKAETPAEAEAPAEVKAEAQAAAEPEAKAPAQATEDILNFETPTEEFDWDADQKGFSGYSKEEREKLENIYSETLRPISKNEIVSGKVVTVTAKDVVLNVGFKSDGLVPLSEFRDMPDLKAGDVVDVYVENQEDKNGQLVLSRKRAKTQKSWERINQALETDEVINGFVKSRTKGGLIVDIEGVEAFLPGSQIDIKPIRDYDQYVGKDMEFKVVKINHEFKNVVVSHKALIEDDLESQKMEIISKLEKGQVLEGTVKNITPFGVFIDLGGVDGLLHITDISWGRIEHPEEVLQLDQKINVVVLDFDDDKKRIALGLKQLTAHPWESLDESIQPGSRVKGKVVTVADYGAFMEIIPGVEGLIHVSEMSWSQHLRNPQEFLKVGDEVEAEVLTIDRDDRKMSLGIKQLSQDPWAGIADRYPVGSQHKAVVRNMTNFGVFVEMEEGIDGLVHISDLSWGKKINHPNEFTKVGEEMEVVVLEVDEENRKLSLGHKQLEENPWDTFETVFTEGSVHQGTVIKLQDKGAIIALPYGVEGFCPGKHLVKEDGTTAAADETLEFKILEFNKDSRRILVSHSRIWEEEKAELDKSERASRKKDTVKQAKTVKKVKESVEKTTLGDLAVLANLKAEMEDSEKQSKASPKAAEPKAEAPKAPEESSEGENPEENKDSE